MGAREWTWRKDMWRNGYLVRAYELMKWNYDWELDPMCDCVPASKIWKHTGEWEIDVYKTYIEEDSNIIRTCHEMACSAKRISKEEATKIWLNIKNKPIPLNAVRDYCETATLEAEAERLMP